MVWGEKYAPEIKENKRKRNEWFNRKCEERGGGGKGRGGGRGKRKLKEEKVGKREQEKGYGEADTEELKER